jgi:hypothetical protein
LPRAKEDDKEVVYVIQALDGGPVKIGHSTRRGVQSRLKSLQIGNHQRLTVRATYSGGMWLERALHEFFALSRLSGEWFWVTQELREWCPEVVCDGDVPTIIVNAEEKIVHDKDVSFDEVTKLAYPTPPYANTLFTVSYRKAHEPKEGTLVAGQSVEVKKSGTIFNVKAI